MGRRWRLRVDEAMVRREIEMERAAGSEGLQRAETNLGGLHFLRKSGGIRFVRGANSTGSKGAAGATLRGVFVGLW